MTEPMTDALMIRELLFHLTTEHHCVHEIKERIAKEIRPGKIKKKGKI